NPVVYAYSACAGDPTTQDLRKSVNVDGCKAHSPLDFLSHGFRPEFRAKHANAQRTVPGTDAPPLELFGDGEHVGECHHDDVGPEVDNELRLFLRLPARQRHHAAPETLRAVVATQPSGEQSVAIRYVHDVPSSAPGRIDRTRHQACPRVDILPRVADDRRLSGGPAGSVNS